MSEDHFNNPVSEGFAYVGGVGRLGVFVDRFPLQVFYPRYERRTGYLALRVGTWSLEFVVVPK